MRLSLERSWTIAAALMVVTNTGACRRHASADATPAASAGGPPGRGALVVVEQTSAEFFEARVLSSEHDTLRVQATRSGDTRHVSVDDAYLLPPAPHTFHAGDLAICRGDAKRWVGCRVVRATGAGVDAVDPDGASLHVPASALIAPTPVTLMNLTRRFKRERERAAFIASVHRAGRPVAPSGWHAAPHERVLALRGDSWYSAEVREIDHDTLHVTWRSDGRESELPASGVAPEPPYDATSRSGDFVLVRPPSLVAAWQPWRVVAVADGAYDVVDIDGTRRTVGPRELVPLHP